MVVTPNFFYLDNNQISRHFYWGNAIGSPNTIDNATNTSMKETTTRVIHSFIKEPISSGAQKDPNGTLNQWAIEIYGRVKDGNHSGLSDKTVKVGKELIPRDEWWANIYYDGLNELAIAKMDQVNGVFYP